MRGLKVPTRSGGKIKPAGDGIESARRARSERNAPKAPAELMAKKISKATVASARQPGRKKAVSPAKSLPLQRKADVGAGSPKIAKKAAVVAPGRKRSGPPSGAERYRFQLQAGEGEVVMQARAGGAKGVFIPLHPDFQAEIREATGGKFYTPAIAALAQWALGELRRRKKKLVISDAGES